MAEDGPLLGDSFVNKRPKLNTEVPNGDDRLSALPDCLLLHILSFLATDHVVMTCLLSKRWKFLWTECSVLDFCQRDYGIVENRRFLDKVDRMMLVIMCKGHHLNKFSVDFCYDKSFSSTVDRWVQFVVENKVKDITLNCRCSSKAPYQLPEILYSYSSLTSLTLGNCPLNHRVAFEWGSLKTLSLNRVEIWLIKNILSGCPVLEVLRIKECCSPCWGSSYWNICSPNLTTLVIERLSGLYASSLEISAPYLRVFSISKDASEIELRFKNISSLVRANINLDRHVILGYTSFSTRNYVTQLLESLKYVKDLELGHWCIEVISLMEMRGTQFPPSTRRCLTLNPWDHTGILPGIMGILRSSPNLETLVIKGRCIPQTISIARYQAARYLERGKLDLAGCHLKTITISGFTNKVLFDEPMLQLVQILLKSAIVLEKMIIRAEEDSIKASSTGTISTDLTKIVETVLAFPRASPKAVVVLS